MQPSSVDELLRSTEKERSLRDCSRVTRAERHWGHGNVWEHEASMRWTISLSNCVKQRLMSPSIGANASQARATTA